MCEVKAVEDTLRLLDYYLKPGGHVIFMEHTGYPRKKFPMRRRLQEMFNPVWSIFGNYCNLNRETIQKFEKFWTIEPENKFTVCWDHILLYNHEEWGVARKPLDSRKSAVTNGNTNAATTNGTSGTPGKKKN